MTKYEIACPWLLIQTFHYLLGNKVVNEHNVNVKKKSRAFQWIFMEKFIISNDKKKEPCSSVNIYEKKKKKHKSIVSNTKHIGKKKKKKKKNRIRL